MLVIVAGNSKSSGRWVVTPISMDPAHFITTWSKTTSKISSGLRGRAVRTTPWLKSLWALGRWAVVPPFTTAAWRPHRGWNSNWSPNSSATGALPFVFSASSRSMSDTKQKSQLCKSVLHANSCSITFDGSSVEINHTPDRLRDVRGRHPLISSVDVKMQIPIRFTDQTDSISFRQFVQVAIPILSPCPFAIG